MSSHKIMSNYIKLDSAQRLNYNTTTASLFSLRSSNMVFSGRYELRSIFIPITFFNINGTNNQIYFTDSAGSHVGVIPPGFYTTNTYIVAVGQCMTAAGSGSVYNCIKNASTQCITIVSSTDSFSFTFNTNLTNSSAVMMGFLLQDTAMAFSQQANSLCSVAQTRSFNISVNNYTTTWGFNGKGYTFVIPITNSTPSFLLYEPALHFPQSFYIDNPTQQLDIGVYDDNHQLIQCYSDFYMILQKV